VCPDLFCQDLMEYIDNPVAANIVLERFRIGSINILTLPRFRRFYVPPIHHLPCVKRYYLNGVKQGELHLLTLSCHLQKYNTTSNTNVGTQSQCKELHQ